MVGCGYVWTVSAGYPACSSSSLSHVHVFGLYLCFMSEIYNNNNIINNNNSVEANQHDISSPLHRERKANTGS